MQLQRSKVGVVVVDDWSSRSSSSKMITNNFLKEFFCVRRVYNSNYYTTKSYANRTKQNKLK